MDPGYLQCANCGRYHTMTNGSSFAGAKCEVTGGRHVAIRIDEGRVTCRRCGKQQDRAKVYRCHEAPKGGIGLCIFVR